ncbi:MAG: pilin, partial [Candidatus Peregrinibacteria bacterium]
IYVMKFMKSFLLASLILFNFAVFSPVGFAQGTVLPNTQFDQMSDCEKIMIYVNANIKNTTVEVEVKNAAGVPLTSENGEPLKVEADGPGIKDIIAGRETISAGQIYGIDKDVKYTDILGCAIKTGDIKLWMVPFFIRYFLEFVIGIAGLVSVGGIIYGGYLYLFAGLSDDKDKGKSAIKNSVIGLVLTLTAWGIVNIVMALVTG